MKIISQATRDVYNMPENMRMDDAQEYLRLEQIVNEKTALGWPCESWKDQKFELIRKYINP